MTKIKVEPASPMAKSQGVGKRYCTHNEEQEAEQGHGEVLDPAPEAVVGLGDGAGHHPEGEQHGELDVTGSQREGEQPRDGEQDLEGEIDVAVCQQPAQQAGEIHRHARHHP
jgi:hypothetical protein